MIDVVQKYLESFYGHRPKARIAGFLTTLPRSRQDPTSGVSFEANGLVHLPEEGTREHAAVPKYKGLGLGMVLSERVRDKVVGRGRISPDEDNIREFLTLIEETSHVYKIMHRLDTGRQVSLLELEMQAVVDRYLVSTSYMIGRTKSLPISYMETFLERHDWSEHPCRTAAPDVYLRDKEAGQKGRVLVKHLHAYMVARFTGERPRQIRPLLREFFYSGLAGKMEIINRLV